MLPSGTRITAQPPSSAMAQTLSSLDRNTCASRRTALASRRTVSRAVSRELDGLVAIGEGTELAFSAMSDTDPALDDAIVTAFVSTFATEMFGFPPTGTHSVERNVETSQSYLRERKIRGQGFIGFGGRQEIEKRWGKVENFSDW